MLEGQAPRFVSAADITRNFGMWQDKVSQGPLVVTHHGRPRVVMLSVEAFEELTAGESGVGRGSQSRGDDGEDRIRFDMLIEQVGGSVMILDRDLCFTRVNAEAVVHFGSPASALLGHSIEVLYPRIADGPLGDAMRRVAQGGEPMALDMPPDFGRGQHWRARIFPLPEGVAVMFRNVTNEVRSEHEAQERIALQAAREAHGRVGVGRLTLRATFEHVEPGLAKLAGFTPDRLKGVRITDLLVLNQRALVQEELESVLARGEARTVHTTMLVNGGNELRICMALAPIREGFGITGAVLLLTAEEG
ncbi:MAG: PAS domain-containing protein [Sphingomonadaceae bacterium]|nr:PAS domain-containing protein [Sphingomonadaceae bacterium]